MIDIEKLKAILATKEGKEEAIAFFSKFRKQDEIYDKQLERAKNIIGDNFSDVVEKIITKYNSDSYAKRYYSKGRQPNETLFHFLFDYAKKYGSEATKKEYNKYGNYFTVEIYKINDYYFNYMNGQGGAIKITKKQ
jgi:hypothetical protein